MDAKITELDANTTPASTDLTVIVDDPGGTPATQKMTIDTLDDYLSATTKTLTNKTLTSPVIQVYDGWQNVNATWTYASATTITVPSGAAALYQKGDKFKLTANSVVLQGYIITVADELLTVVGDALTNHTFTNNFYSHASNPIGFPITPKCRVYLSANQENLVSGNWTKINYDSESYDIGSNYDTTNKRFVAPITGYYLVSHSVYFANIIPDHNYYSGIYVNGALYIARALDLAAEDTQNVLAVDIVPVTAGQYIEGYARQLSGSNTPDVNTNQQYGYMTIHFLSI